MYGMTVSGYPPDPARASASTAAAGAVDAPSRPMATATASSGPRRRDRRPSTAGASPPSWARPAPASRRCMHCLAGLDSLTSGARATSADADLATLQRQGAHRGCAATRSASSSRPSTCCPRSTAQREHHASRCPRRPQARQGVARHRRRHRRPRRPPEPPPERAVRRPAAARRRRPRPRAAAGRSSSPTSRPATSTAAAGGEILGVHAAGR